MSQKGGININKKPNVILVLADDMGIGDLSCYNPQGALDTVNIDALAAKGLRFDDAHASSALCTPSRYGLLTGRYCWRSRLKRMVLSGYEPHLIEDGRLTIASLFKREGYRTACVGKWHLGLDWETTEKAESYGLSSEEIKAKGIRKESLLLNYGKAVKNGPNAFGFDYCYVTPGSLDIAPYVFIENDKVTTPPSAISGNEEFWKTKLKGTGKDIPYMSAWPPGQIAPDYSHSNVTPDSANRVLSLIDSYSGGDDPFFIYYPLHAPHVPCIPTPDFEGKSMLGPYGDMVLMIDDIVGRIIRSLEINGIIDDTIVIFTSDNGGEHCFPESAHCTNHIYRGYKSDIWDGGHRIPFIVSCPGLIPQNDLCHHTICLTDLLATFAELLGVTLNEHEGEDSISILSIWRGISAPVRDYTVHHSGLGMFAIRKGKWKLEMCGGGGGFTRPGSDFNGDVSIQLYDMEIDERESSNLAGSFPDIVDDLICDLTNCIRNGRSSPGPAQFQDSWWPELNWLPCPG